MSGSRAAGALRRSPRACAAEVDGEVLFDARAAAAIPPTPRSTRSSRSAWWCRAAKKPRAPRSRSRPRRACRSCRAAPAARSAARRWARRWSSTTPSTSTSVLEVDPAAARAVVQPGMVLDALNAQLRAARPVVSGGRLDQRAGDARRHGGQQLVRLALDRLRQHGAQRARHRRAHADGERWRFGPMEQTLPARPSMSSSSPGCKRLYERENATRSKRAFRRCCAKSPATTSITSARRTPTPRICWSAPKARSPGPSGSASEARAAARRRARSACATSRSSTPRWSSRSTSSSSARRRWSWSTAP